MQFQLPTDFNFRLDLYDLDEKAVADLARLWPVVHPAMSAGIERFLARELQMPMVRHIFERHADVIRRLETDHLRFFSPGSSGRPMPNRAAHCARRKPALG